MSLLHYVTYKYVVIRDKRLGVAYYSLAFVIVFYTLLQLLLQKSYLEFDVSPQGSIRLLVNTPSILKENEMSQINESYCCQGQAKANDNRQHSEKMEQPRCKECQVLDALSLNWPVEARSISIATLIKRRWEERSGIQNTPHMFKQVSEIEFFTWRPEDVVFKIEHSMSAFDRSVSASHRLMDGILTNDAGESIQSLSSASGKSKVNKITLKNLLDAASVPSLDAKSDALNGNGRSYRENGILIRVSIDYRNAETSLFGTGVLTYAYTAHHVPYSDYRVKQELPLINWSPDGGNTEHAQSEKRVVMKRYATRVEFIQTGKIGRFSLANLIVQVVSALGLLTLTATVIDVLALYIVPSKHVYRQYIFDHSPDLRRPIKDVSLDKEHED